MNNENNDLEMEDNKEELIQEWVDLSLNKTNEKESIDILKKIDDYLLENDLLEKNINDTVNYDSDELIEKLNILTDKNFDCYKFFELIEKSKTMDETQKKIFKLMEKYKKLLLKKDFHCDDVLFVSKILLLKQSIWDQENRDTLIKLSTKLPNTLN